MRPDYTISPRKFASRHRVIAIIREITGWTCLPPDMRYWCLANQQPALPGAEIEQLVAEGFIAKSQFVGVDYDPGIIASNRLLHPAATWYAGEFLDIIRSHVFDPGVAGLDTEGTFKTQSDLIASTMLRCPPGAVLVATLVDGHVYTGERYAITALRDSLSLLLPDAEMDCWNPEYRTFTYRTNLNHMRTYVLRKETLDVR